MLLVIVSLFGILLSSLSLLSGKKMYLLLIRITSLESLYASLAFLMTFLPAFDVLLLSCMVSSFSHVSVLQSYSSLLRTNSGAALSLLSTEANP